MSTQNFLGEQGAAFLISLIRTELASKSKTEVIDALDSVDTFSALSAAQGKILNDRLTAVEALGQGDIGAALEEYIGKPGGIVQLNENGTIDPDLITLTPISTEELQEIISRKDDEL